MADTILILGNGFDLAMGRKTSYKDFLGVPELMYHQSLWYLTYLKLPHY